MSITLYILKILKLPAQLDTAIFLPSIDLPDLVNTVTTPSNRCAPFGNGQISVELTNFSGGLGYADYDFRLYSGSNFDPNNLANNLVEIIPAPAGGPVVFTSSLNPGTYTIVAEENFGACFSDPVTVEVELDFTFPTFDFAVTADKFMPWSGKWHRTTCSNQ